MIHFRLPRKIKKHLKRTIWLYPPDEKGDSLMAFPTESNEDFRALKHRTLRALPDKRNSRARRKEFLAKINKEIYVSNELLKTYIDNLIRKDLKVSSYDILIAAKNSKLAVIAYFNFVNAYQLYEKGDDSFGNVCCLAIDRAKDLLK